MNALCAELFPEGRRPARTIYQAAALPLAGIRLPGETVRETIRKTVDAVLEYTRLYDVLASIVYREWDPSYNFDPIKNPEAPHLDCYQCGAPVYLPPLVAIRLRGA